MIRERTLSRLRSPLVRIRAAADGVLHRLAGLLLGGSGALALARLGLRSVGVRVQRVHLMPLEDPGGLELIPTGPAIREPIRTRAGATTQDFAPSMFPAIRYRVLSSAVVAPGSAGALIAGLAHRRAPVGGEDHMAHRGTVPRLMAHRDGEAVTAWRREVGLETAVSLCGPWTFNYYHWMTEYLPLAMMAQRLPEPLRSASLLLDRTALRLPAVEETLRLFRLPGSVVLADPRDTYRVGRLIMIDAPKLVAAEIGGGRVARYLGEVLHESVMVAYRTELLRRLGVPVDGAGKGPPIVAVRPPGASRPYNQDQIVARLRGFGFVPVDPGRLSVRDQARLFLRASVICGPAGAAMTNLLFSGAGTTALVWGRPEPALLRRAWWGNLAAVGGAQVILQPSEGDPTDRSREYVDEEEIVATLSEIGLLP